MSHNPNTLENRNGIVKTLAEWEKFEATGFPVEESVIEETPIIESIPVEEPIIEPADTIPEPIIEADIGVRPRGRPPKKR